MNDEGHCAFCKLRFSHNDVCVPMGFFYVHRGCYIQKHKELIQSVSELEKWGVEVTADFSELERGASKIDVGDELVVLAIDHEAELAEKNREIARLRNAIRRHRENVWGERGGIYHDEDMELYAELGEQELQTDE